MRATLAVFAFALFGASGALAEDATDPIAAGRAIIARAQASDLFTPIEDGTRITVRHNNSHLVCHFRPNEYSDIHIYPARDGGPPRGDDVSCGSHISGATATFYATRYPQAVSVDDALAESVYEITQVSPQAQEYDSVIPHDPLEPISSRTQAFIIPNFQRQSGVFYSRTSVVAVDGWVYLMRFTGAQGIATEQAAEDSWRAFEAELSAPHPVSAN